MRLKRIGCIMLVMILSLAITTPANSYAAGKFSDIKGHWAESYINNAVSDGFIQGYPDGRFQPDKAVTRAEFAAMINKALGNSGTAGVNFNDVHSGDWYYNDVAKAVAATYAAGYSDGSFKPDGPITRQEAAVMLARIIPTSGSGNLSAYPDKSSIADWAYDAMGKINGEAYVGAYNDGNIHPLDQLTRGQTAKIICSIIDHENIVTGNTIIKDDGTKLSGKIYPNNVTIQKDLDDGDATIDGCIILGSLYVNGGGEDSITINNSRISNCIVNKDKDPVHLIVKGETAIGTLSAEQSSILQTSGLTGGLLGPGFININVKGSAEVTLKGSFPAVNVAGTKAKITLSSGTISDLTISSAGKYSDVTAESGTSISNATVNAESYFHGSGTISHMNVNADNVTYETKPRDWTIGSGAKTPTAGDANLDVTFSPKNGVKDVKLDTKITLTFDSVMEMKNGDSITSSNIKDFITLRKETSTGSKVGFSAAISSSKKVITITPDSHLTNNTKYYVTLEGNSIQNDDDKKMDEETIYFTTGATSDNVSTTFSPANGATGVSASPSITITLSDDVVRYSNGNTISASDSYLKDCLVFRKANSSGDSVSYSASISSSKKVITITPSSSLTLNQKYYVAIVASKLKSKEGGIAVPASSVTWTTGVTTPVVDSLNLTPGTSTITANVTPNINGTAYLVALPSTYPAITAAQVVAGQNASGTTVASSFRTNGSVTSGSSKSFILSGFDGNSQYTIYAVISGNSLNSAVKSATAATTKEVTRLSSLSVVPNGVSSPGNQISFNASTLTYNISLNTGITTLQINAAGPGNISIDGDSAVAYGAAKDINLSGTSQTIKVSTEKSNTDGTVYSINVDRTDNAGIDSLTVKENGNSLTDTGGKTYNLTTTGAVTIDVSVSSADKYAAVIINGNETIQTGSVTFDLEASTAEQSFSFSIRSGSVESKYDIKFIRPAPSGE